MVIGGRTYGTAPQGVHGKRHSLQYESLRSLLKRFLHEECFHVRQFFCRKTPRKARNGRFATPSSDQNLGISGNGKKQWAYRYAHYFSSNNLLSMKHWYASLKEIQFIKKSLPYCHNRWLSISQGRSNSGLTP